MEFKDYYKILGVEKNASLKDIKQAYRRLARQVHPDVNPNDKTAEARFKEINEAYEVLGDKEKRAKYDQLGANWKTGGYPPPPPGGGYSYAQTPEGGFAFNIEDLLRGRGAQAGGEDLGGFSDFFNIFFGGEPPRTGRAGAAAGGRRARQPQRGEDLESPLEISLEEAVFGTQRSFQLEKQESCKTCGGSGRSGGRPCPTCGGSGIYVFPRRLDVKVPPGVREGSKVRVAGEGQAGIAGGPPGDLLLVVKILPHPHFEVRGADLYTEVPLGIPEAVLGGEIEVPLLKGRVSMKIPPLTSSGKTFRLSGQGLPATRNKPAGDLFVKVKIVVPERISEKERELFQELFRLSLEKNQAGRSRS